MRIYIWGKDIAALKGRSPLEEADTKSVADFVKIPKEDFVTASRRVSTVDSFFVNKIPFFLTLSRKICLRMSNHTPESKISNSVCSFQDMSSSTCNEDFNHEPSCGWQVCIVEGVNRKQAGGKLRW